MGPTQFSEAHLSHVYHQLAHDLAQATSLAEAAQLSVHSIDTCLQPYACHISWHGGGIPALFGSATPLHEPAPHAHERAWLLSGDIALRQDDDDSPTRCFAPLRARNELLGWIYLETYEWNSDMQLVLGTLAAQIGPVLALLASERTQHDRVAQLQAIVDVSRSFSGELQLDALLERVYAGVCRLMSAPHFSISLYLPETNEFAMSYMITNGQRVNRTDRWKATIGLAQFVAQSRMPLCTDDYIAECQRRGIEPKIVGPDVARAWLGIPLYTHQRLIGILIVFNTHDSHVYTNDHVELLTAFSAPAAVAIENAQLYQQSERQARDLAAMSRIGRTITSSLDAARVPTLIMEQVCEVLGVEEGSLLLADETSGDLVFAYTNGTIGNQLLGQHLPRGKGIAGYVVSTGKSLIVGDAQRDERFYAHTDRATGFVTRAMLAVPLRGAGGIQGVIEVLNPRHGGSFTIQDQRLLESIADQAVIALDNARTYTQVDRALAERAQQLVETNDRLEHNLQSLTALNAVALAMNTTLQQPDEIFAMTARGVMELTQAVGTSVLLMHDNKIQRTMQLGTIEPIADFEALMRQVVHAGRPAITSATASGHQVFIAPLRALQRTLGVLCVFFADRLPDPSDQETIVLFASQAAGAVDSTQLFTEVRSARDAMASILASTNDGVMLIDTALQITLANAALAALCGVAPNDIEQRSIVQFLASWKTAATYEPAEWHLLRRALSRVVSGQAAFESGEFNALVPAERTLEWHVLKVAGSGTKQEGALLVLRDITAAKEAERVRVDLTNMIVHDLRSPLSSVMAAIDMLVRGVAGVISPKQQHMLNIAFNASSQMLDMINTLLNISRLEDGRIPLSATPCVIRTLVDQASERLTNLARERNVIIQTDIPETLPDVSADTDLAVRVIQNLLGNALKFSRSGSTVLIRSWEVDAQRPAHGQQHDAAERTLGTPAMVCVAISDRGIGIDPKDQEKIFAKFSQIGNHQGGSGLGLTFCKLAVEAHHGTIWVESALGEGSTFFFTLPVTAQRP